MSRAYSGSEKRCVRNMRITNDNDAKWWQQWGIGGNMDFVSLSLALFQPRKTQQTSDNSSSSSSKNNYNHFATLLFAYTVLVSSTSCTDEKTQEVKINYTIAWCAALLCRCAEYKQFMFQFSSFRDSARERERETRMDAILLYKL